MNVALQLFAAFTTTLVVAAVPLHAPPQLVNVYPDAGAAVSVAVVPLASVTAHAAPPAPHVSPFPVTVPPVGTGAIVSAYVPPGGAKFAVHVRAPCKLTEYDADVPLQSPDQPVNVYPELAVAAMPIVIATGIVTAHAVPPAPQLIPAPVTLPPVGGVIVSVYGGPVGSPPPLAVNVALQLFAASTTTLVVAAVPLHAPPQLVNVYPDAGAAVSVAVVPLASVTAHAAPPAPHVSPLPVTVPPVGTGAIVSA